jgi:hypothetical protein
MQDDAMLSPETGAVCLECTSSGGRALCQLRAVNGWVNLQNDLVVDHERDTDAHA